MSDWTGTCARFETSSRVQIPMPYGEVESKNAALPKDCDVDLAPVFAAYRRLSETETVDELMTASALPAGSAR